MTATGIEAAALAFLLPYVFIGLFFGAWAVFRFLRDPQPHMTVAQNPTLADVTLVFLLAVCVWPLSVAQAFDSDGPWCG